MPFQALAFFFIVITMSAIIHEYAHGWVADRLGDPTAKYAGRLTLNPMAHIDPFGTLLLPLLMLLVSNGSFLFAYAKPVPYNPFNLRYGKWGSALVAGAGPLSNLILAIVFGILIRVLPVSTFGAFLSIIVYANILLMVFNLVPIPPLDGSKILFALLPERFNQFKQNLERYGPILLLFFIFFLFRSITPIIGGLFQLIVGYRFF
ncbi:hypothetical protein CL634_04825 [bacterium]|nr:hypothetical protein [bacterium]|tara:strand:+ start:979 stop:1593 length:615 start_codon:yes stop_codon:yes gene_type:complete